MKLLSLFDGEGGFPLSGVLNGIEPVGAAEVEPYPIAVTRSRFPHMKHYGNVCKINGAEIEPVDIITFGSPCQDLSVAGKRAGIQDGERSNLFFEAVRIIKEMRDRTNGEYPKYAVWENVPGAFSSNKGYDFHAVLEALCSVCDSTVSIPKPYDAKRANQLVWRGAGEIVGDSYSIAWRTLDAQYWGVPQRRKRIYLIADFGSQRAGEILFKHEGRIRDSSEGRKTRKSFTINAMGSVDGSIGSVAGINQPRGIGRTFGIVTKGNGEAFLSEEKHATLTTCGGQAGQGYPAILSMTDTLNGSLGIKCLNPWDSQTSRVYDSVGVHPAISANSGGGQDRHGVVYSFDSMSSNSMKSSNPNSGCREVDVAKCIDTTFPDPSKNQGGVCVVQPCAAFMGGQGEKAGSIANSESVSPTLKGCASGLNQAPSVVAFAQNQRDEVRDLGDKTGALAAEAGVHQQTYVAQRVVALNDQGGSSINVESEEISPTLRANSHQHEPVIALQANGIYRADTAGCNGAGWREDQMYTLNTVDKHAVVFESNGFAGFKEGVGTLRRNGGDIGGGSENIVCQTYPDICGTLAASGEGCSRTAGQGNEADFCIVSKSDPARRYIVRRLMPIETTRLQGYPDFWHHLAPFDGDVEFWESVRKTWARINGTTYKPFKDIARLEKWYYKLRNDGAEYKADGNSLAIPCAEYVVRRIAETVREEEKLSAEETI